MVKQIAKTPAIESIPISMAWKLTKNKRRRNKLEPGRWYNRLIIHFRLVSRPALRCFRTWVTRIMCRRTRIICRIVRRRANNKWSRAFYLKLWKWWDKATAHHMSEWRRWALDRRNIWTWWVGTPVGTLLIRWTLRIRLKDIALK